MVFFSKLLTARVTAMIDNDEDLQGLDEEEKRKVIRCDQKLESSQLMVLWCQSGKSETASVLSSAEIARKTTFPSSNRRPLRFHSCPIA